MSGGGKPGSPEHGSPRLASLQDWFLAQLQPGARRAAGPVAGTRGLSGRDRVGIYADMYRARLIDALGQEYPRLAEALGAPRFARFATSYLRRFPSRQPTIQNVGDRLPGFLARELKAGRVARFPYAADLARLEQVSSQVYLAADSPGSDSAPGDRLDARMLQAVPAAAWPDLRFRVTPSLRVVRLGFQFPRSGSQDRDRPVRGKVAYRVYRRDLEVYEAPMDAAEARALALVARGQSFGEVCLALEDAQKAATALATWVDEGLLSLARGS